ncbi:MAG: heat-inducible transcriptional repressor HrcA [Saccharofermentanales bacterium]
MALEDRQKLILKAIIDDYISTAEPVGSKNLLLRNNFNISSATVRNEMSELENNGYLIHPHTSAGRIPTDKGYREYVDNLITIPVMTEEETKRFHDYFKDGFDEITNLLHQASHALSQNTGYTSMTLTPRLNHSLLKQIKMLMIEPGRVLMVVVLGEGVIKDRVVRVPDMLDAEQILQLSNAIENGLVGMPLEEISFITVALAGKKTKIPESLLNQILYETYVSIKQADNIGVFLEGSNKILEYPEFTDVRKVRTYMDTLSEHGVIAGYLDEAQQELENPKNIEGTSVENGISVMKNRPYMIRIGQEIALSGLKDCSFVTTSYQIGEKVVGSIGVIGPKRMEYGKVISQINFVRMMINDEIKKINKSNTMEVHNDAEDKRRK